MHTHRYAGVLSIINFFPNLLVYTKKDNVINKII